MSARAGPVAPGETIQLAEVADFWLGPLLVQPSTRRVRAGSREELVEPRVMQALVALAEADGSVVSRDALIERCWGGRIVGEDAINRCVAKVRRLAETVEPAAFSIDTIARVGYRLTSSPREAVLEAVLEAGAIEVGAAVEVPGSARRLWAGRGMVAAVLLVAAAAVAWAMRAPAAPADRMTLRIEPFTAIGSPPAGELAGAFTQAAVERLSESEILVVSTAAPSGDAGPAAPRYVLAGTIQTAGGSVKIMVQVVERLSGKLLYTTQTQKPAGISQPAVYGITVWLLAGVERHIREAELARYHGEPRDVEDMVLQASAEAGVNWQPGRNAAALALGERALAQEPGNLAAQSVMARLLFEDFLASDATRGDAEGRRALALIENVLRRHPRNLTHRHLHASLLLALGDLRGAQSEAERALADEPDSNGNLETLSMALLQQGDVAGSVRVLPREEAELDDVIATQEFAEGRYEDALRETQRDGSLSQPDGMFLLRQAAILGRLGQLPAARSAMARALQALPPELQRVAALRQCLFGLPDASWQIFKNSLIAAGMPA